MKFTVDSKALAYAAHKCGRLTMRSQTFAYLSTVKIEAKGTRLIVSSTNNYAYLTVYVNGVSIAEEGEAIVDARALQAFLTFKSGQLDVHSTEHNLIFKIGGNKLQSKLYSGFFPDKPEPQGDSRPINVSGDVLERMFNVALMAAPYDSSFTRPALAGMLFVLDSHDGHTTVYTMATDSYKLGYTWNDIEYIGADGKLRFLMHPVSADILPMILASDDKIQIFVEHGEKNRIFFASDRFMFSTSELGGEFPYKQISTLITSPRQHSGDVASDELSAALKACSAIIENTSNIAAKKVIWDMDLGYNLLTIGTGEHAVGEMKLNVAISSKHGSPFVFELNYSYAQTIISVLERVSEESVLGKRPVNVSLSEETHLVYFSVAGETALFACAPMGMPSIKGSQ